MINLTALYAGAPTPVGWHDPWYGRRAFKPGELQQAQSYRANAALGAQWTNYLNQRAYRDDMLAGVQGELDTLGRRSEAAMSKWEEEHGAALATLRQQIATNNQRYEKYMKRYEKFTPVEDAVIKGALDGIFDRSAAEGSLAAAEQAQQGDIAEQELAREMARYGVNPTSGRYVSSQRALELAKRASIGAARTGAVREFSRYKEGADWQRKIDAMKLRGDEAEAAALFNNEGIARAIGDLSSNRFNAIDRYDRAAAGYGAALAEFSARNKPKPPPQRRPNFPVRSTYRPQYSTARVRSTGVGLNPPNGYEWGGPNMYYQY